MFKKIFCAILMFTAFSLQAFADELSGSINSILNSFDFDKDSVVSISIKDKKTGLNVYEKNPYKFLNPASVLKILTMAASMDTLGENYSLDMVFYKDKKNNLYLKLSADPLFTSEDANTLAENLKKVYKGRINKIFIDDSVIDKIPYPDGWTIDDYWPNAPKISPYMIDRNTVKIDIHPEFDGRSTKIVQKDKDYRFSFVNKVQMGDNNSINFVEDETHNTINVEGTIKTSVTGYEVPVLNPKYYFCKKLNNALNKNGIVFHDKFLFAKTPKNATPVAKFSRPLEEVVKHTLEVSDNLSAEMIFKIAGGKYASNITSIDNDYASFGTTQNGVNMFNDYYQKLGLDTKNIKIRDGSGVSRYSAINANWIANALIKTNFNFEKYLPTSGFGTLEKRMREMKGDVYFKTGTLYGVSSLAGVIKSENKEYVFVSIIMSYNRNKSLLKGIEDEIVYEVYRNINEK